MESLDCLASGGTASITLVRLIGTSDFARSEVGHSGPPSELGLEGTMEPMSALGIEVLRQERPESLIVRLEQHEHWRSYIVSPS